MTNIDSVKTDTGHRVRRLMGFNCLNQKDIACLLGCSRSTVSQKLSGNIQFSQSELIKLSDKFGVSVDALLGREPLEVS